MLVDIEFDAQKWIDEDILPEYRNQVWYTNLDDGGIVVGMHNPETGEDFKVHQCNKENLPEGVYYASLNFEQFIDNFYDVDHSFWYYEDDYYHVSYGLCDNVNQVFDFYKNTEFVNGKDKFVLLLTPFYREDEPEHEGFRYHKWASTLALRIRNTNICMMILTLTLFTHIDL